MTPRDDCGEKVRYATEAAAAHRLAQMLQGFTVYNGRRVPLRPGKRPTRYYQCPTCDGWHLTARPAWSPR